MIRSALAFALLLSSLTTQARDIVPKDPNQKYYVQVTRQDDHTISFKRCDLHKVAPCKQIGARSSYSTEELVDIRQHYKLRGYATAGGEAALVLAVAAGTGGLGFMTVAAGGGEFSTALVGQIVGYTALTSGTTAGGLAGLNALSDAVNPMKQFDRAETVSDDVLKDRRVAVEDIAEVIKDLDHVLRSID